MAKILAMTRNACCPMWPIQDKIFHLKIRFQNLLEMKGRQNRMTRADSMVKMVEANCHWMDIFEICVFLFF